jgi:hypothetical protein
MSSTFSAGPKMRSCRICEKPFPVIRQRADANRQHCSHECAVESARASRRKFYKEKPHKAVEYHRRSRERLGPDGNLRRFYARYPDAPRSCQSCGESRVLDVAHKPGHERNGAWRSKSNTMIEKVWILCPTCHALLDRMGYSPAELGLET